MDASSLFEPRRAALALALASAAALLAALAFEHFAGAEPCPLCIWQRWPHVGVVVLGLAALWLWPLAMVALAGLLLLGNAGLAGYHVGIEQGLWMLPSGCTAGATASSVEELRALLAEAPPACDQVSFTFMGLSLAVWNALICLGLTTFSALVVVRAAPARGPRRRERVSVSQ